MLSVKQTNTAEKYSNWQTPWWIQVQQLGRDSASHQQQAAPVLPTSNDDIIFWNN